MSTTISANVLADSINSIGDRVVTWEYVAPKFLLQEINTHCMLARNAESSRAVPVMKRINQIEEDPFIPLYFGKNQKGMQAAEEVDAEAQGKALEIWLAARDSAVLHARGLNQLGLHKQLVNRILEPYTWAHGIITGSPTMPASLQNFFGLRAHPDAEPHFQQLAEAMRASWRESAPMLLADGEMHLPLIRDEDREQFSGYALLQLSAARCARVSYNTHMGVRDPNEDFRLYTQLLNNGHMSSLEHPCIADKQNRYTWFDDYGVEHTRPQIGKFVGFMQYRHTIRNEVRACNLQA